MSKKTLPGIIRNSLIAILLLILGTVLGYKYAQGQVLAKQAQLPIVRNLLPAPQVQTPAAQQISGDTQPPDNINLQADFDVFWEVWSLLERDYLEPEKLDSKKMVNGAISGMTAAVGDSYTMYLPPTDNKRSGENLAGKFYGVGIELGYIDQTLAVISPLEGTPAAKAGLQAGDLILHVKDEQKEIDEDTTDWTLVEAVNKIRGKKGQPITFTIYRESKEEPFKVTVERGEIVVESVKLEFVEHNEKRVAHLKLSRFGGRTMKEWDQAVETITSQANQIDGIALDLRNNPGGYFETSIEVASDFIENDVVVSQKSKYSQQDYPAEGQARLDQFPLVVLVNKGSASASEIVAGAIRDDLGAKLVGQRTFGKGTVQDRRSLSNGGGVHITVGRWLLPKGDWIHEEGLPVDVEAEQNQETEEDEVLLKAIEAL
jgi:carboxyl-terminal processing protease